ncbi:MAG: phosphate ABC transporter permease PstA, partial [Gammaproteobacteria bacterium]
MNSSSNSQPTGATGSNACAIAVDSHKQRTGGFLQIWVMGGAAMLCAAAVVGLFLLLMVGSRDYFWIQPVVAFSVQEYGDEPPEKIVGQIRSRQLLSPIQLEAMGESFGQDQPVARISIKVGNKEHNGLDFMQILSPHIVSELETPPDVLLIERHSWGNFYGWLEQVGPLASGDSKGGEQRASGDQAYAELQRLFPKVQQLVAEADDVQQGPLAELSWQLEQNRHRQAVLRKRRAEGAGAIGTTGTDPAPPTPAQAELSAQYQQLSQRYMLEEERLQQLRVQARSWTATLVSGQDRRAEINLADIVRFYRPNDLSVWSLTSLFFIKIGEFLSTEPREANTEGGVFPAIFGTICLVLLMTILVAPFGVLSAFYLHEYRRQGAVVRLIRVCINNLAGVPSIVFGIFGLGFFVYGLGGSIDELFFADHLPNPTLGTPGLFWAALTLSLLTLPVVVVATEEGLARIPSSMRQGALALGATRFEMLSKVVFPMAVPGILTGLILAIARAAGEVAPLMLVGAVKFAPDLPVDGHFPFVHLDQKFMHLGFHIYDAGFQSPNSEAALPLVYASSLLL